MLGKGHPDTATSYDKVGTIYRCVGNYAEALAYRKKKLQYTIKTGGELSLNSAQAYNNVGAQYRDLGQYDEALEYVCKALSIAESLNDVENIATYHNRLGRIFQKKVDIEQAVRHFQKAIELLPEDHPESIDSRERLKDIQDKKQL